MEKLKVIPSLKSITFKLGMPFILKKAKTIGINNKQLESLANLCCNKLEEKNLFLVIKNNSLKEDINLELTDIFELKDKGQESYKLNIEKDKVFIKSSSTKGIFYGLQTFFQLIENNYEIPLLEISDWATLKIRGVHFMLAGPIPKFEWFLQAIENLAKYKINTILLEYEDKFPYEKHNLIKHPLAFSKEQLKKIIEVAENNYIQVIPLLQSLGHVGYILKHKEYAYLREREYDPYQYCPSNLDSFNLFKDLASEIISFHKNVQYFHVGADETYFLGQCKICREKTKSFKEKSMLYINHLNKVCDFILSSGKTPILWSDMLIDFPQYIEKLNKKAIIMYWNYSPSFSLVPYIKWKGRAYIGDDIKEDIPSDIFSIYLPYWDNGQFPYLMNSFPYTKFFKDSGFEVIVAPIADQIQTVLNVSEFTNNAVKNKCLGAVTTCWPLFPVYQTLFGFMATAEQTWNTDISRKDFSEKLSYRCFGIMEKEIMQLTYLLKSQLLEKEKIYRCEKILDKCLKKTIKNKELLQGLDLLAEEKKYTIEKKEIFEKVEHLMKYIKIVEWNEFVEIIDYNLPYQEKELLNIENLKCIVNNLKNLRESLKELERKVKQTLLPIASSESIDEYLKFFYKNDEEKIERYLSPLKLLLTGKQIEVTKFY